MIEILQRTQPTADPTATTLQEQAKPTGDVAPAAPATFAPTATIPLKQTKAMTEATPLALASPTPTATTPIKQIAATAEVAPTTVRLVESKVFNLTILSPQQLGQVWKKNSSNKGKLDKLLFEMVRFFVAIIFVEEIV